MHEPSSKNKKNVAATLRDARQKKLRDLEELGIQPYSTGFRPDADATEFKSRFAETVDSEPGSQTVKMAGRIVALRVLGKATFARVRDASDDFQVYFARDTIGKPSYSLIKKLDIGDIIGVAGRPFRTRTGELSVLADEFKLLTKSLRPLPEKWHGLSDVETRYRQRYVDLIVNPPVREIVKKRTRIISYMRDYLTDRGFLEVETPMMQPIPGGATAKPFETFHHSLDRNLFLRIAPELYLKRLLVGGFDRVFEINRNFRNEGLSTQHNPEFTMLEFYQAYATYEDLMTVTEDMFSGIAQEVQGGWRFSYGDREVDFTPPWERVSVREALLKYAALPEKQIDDRQAVFIKASEMGLPVDRGDSLGKLWMAIFDEVVEPQLWGPVFVHRYPVEVSPLARAE